MLFTNDRNQIRRYFCQVWQKYQQGQALEPMENIIAQVIAQHPEYQPLLSDADAILERDYAPEDGETNPFLHMGLHIAVHEQINSRRPPGILDIYQTLCARFGDPHSAEHQIMECLAMMLWEAQHNGIDPDETLYLQKLRRLAGHD